MKKLKQKEKKQKIKKKSKWKVQKMDALKNSFNHKIHNQIFLIHCNLKMILLILKLIKFIY